MRGFAKPPKYKSFVPLESDGPLGRDDSILPRRQASFANTGAGEGMDVVPVLRTIRSVATQHVEDGQRIEIARMQQLLADRD
jgi:hypothetical protein